MIARIKTPSAETGDIIVSGQCVVVIYHDIVVNRFGAISKGGAEIYVVDLCRVAARSGYNVNILQFGDVEEHFVFENFRVTTKVWRGSLYARSPSRKIRWYMKKFNPNSTIVIFSSETACVKLRKFNTILVQHGIGFDFSTSGKSLGPLSHLRSTGLVQWLVRMSILHAARCVEHIVAVDYVYPTWLRTYFPDFDKNILTLPNFSRVPAAAPKTRRSFRRILFARRMVRRRGVVEFAVAVKTLLDRNFDIHVTFAGDGACVDEIKKMFGNDSRVTFTNYDPSDALKIHLQHDIAVVPSLASEGTSLSLLEGMATKCAMVSTGVGGLSNVVIDNHNGLVCAPDAASIASAIERLILDSGLARRLSECGYQTVLESFSYEKWSKSWMDMLSHVAN